MRLWIAALVFLEIVGALVCCRSTAQGASQQEAFTIPELGVRYTPPADMQDRTPAAGLEARRHVLSNTSKIIQPLLVFTSGGSDSDRDWHNVAIFAYPRSHWSQLDDDAAKLKVSTIISGGQGTPSGTPQTATFSGQRFTVFTFELKESPLVKRARIYTTILKGQLLSFAFVANSGDDLKPMEETMNALELSNR